MYWYLFLFFTAFIAATILPGSPDAVLVYILSINKNAILGVIAATLGASIGASLNYYVGLGIYNSKLLDKLIPSKKEFDSALHRYEKYGMIGLFFSWFPFIGDPLTFIAGYLKLPFRIFSLWVFLGRLVRFIIVAYIAVNI